MGLIIDTKGEDGYNPKARFKVVETKPLTNYDLLISKTPEEMAELFRYLCCLYSLGGKGDCNAKSKSCYQRWLDWLKAPVEQEGEG